MNANDRIQWIRAARAWLTNARPDPDINDLMEMVQALVEELDSVLEGP